MNPRLTLLTRDQFREHVFARDKGRCVFCGATAVDAHHILERCLWPDGGYYLDNGASLCEAHHLDCEYTRISVEEICAACGIAHPLLPPQLEVDQRYDKWGNPQLANGQRLKGELFFEDNVQKALALGGMLDRFSDWVKYPRTYHLPWSDGVSNDDRIIESLAGFTGQRVLVTEKMDGENTTLYCDYLHARSLDGRSHSSRNWVKQFWSSICADIPPGWRICGENLYARHSIAYSDLTSYFLGFSVWNERNVCLPWNESLEWFTLLGITPVPLLYDGIYDEKRIRALWDTKSSTQTEGYVVRIADAIAYSDFRRKVAKFVRRSHVQTDQHWMHQAQIERNLLRG